MNLISPFSVGRVVTVIKALGPVSLGCAVFLAATLIT